MHRNLWKLGLVMGAAVLLASLANVSSLQAYEQYSQNRDATNCRACHGNFRSSSYTSQVDGMNWGNLHDLHRSTMLSGDCDTCHGGNKFPVLLNSSLGGNGLSPISCMGCHGRNEDNTAANPASPNGLGAGLRQHHFVSGVELCSDCHADANPASYTPVGENVLPEYYVNPGTGHPAMPTAPCLGSGGENFAGATSGLDNDGDGVYDLADGDCAGTPVEPTSWAALKALYGSR